MRSAVPIVLVVLLVSGGALSAFAASSSSPEVAAASGAPTVTNVRIPGGEPGIEIAITVFQPDGATAAAPVPVVLNSHGWAGSRTTTLSGIVGRLVDEGYGVVTFDARGHGESDGVATVHNKDHELLDFIALLDWIHDNLDWVARDTTTGIAKDIVAGATGGSYGGGYQLMTASYDGRLDALVPEITWNDLTYSLGTNGVVKSVWVDALYGAASAGATRISPDIDRWWREVQVTNEFPADAYAHFKASSPVPQAITADVLLVQGLPDLLFNTNEALRNHAALEAGAAGDVRLVTHLGGHVLPGVQPMALHRDRPGNTQPCGDVADMTVAWFAEHLLGQAGAAAAIPEASWALEDGTCVQRDTVEPDTTLTVTFPALATPQVAGTLLVPLLQGPALIAGVPTLQATATTVLPATLNAGLAVGGPDGVRIVDDQSTGLRLQPGEDIDLDLVAVATRLDPGETLYLRIDGLNEWYAHNSGRLPGAVLMQDVTVTLPLLTA